MASPLRGSQFLTVAGKYVLDRVQSAGPGDVTIDRTKNYELGNNESIGTTEGIPQVGFNVESFDVSPEFECVIVNKNPLTFPSTPGSNEIDFRDAVPIDIISPIKTKKNSDTITSGAITPYSTLSSVTYRFGVGDNATQTFGFNGDTLLYTPGQPYIEEFTNIGEGPYTIANTAELYSSDGSNVYITSVMLCDSTDNTYERVYYDSTGDGGYTNTATTFTLPTDTSATYDTVKVTYSSQTKVDYPQTGNGPAGTKVHEGVSVKPAAVRSYDLDVYIGSVAATPVFSRMTGVQNIEANWSVTLENGEELGNKHYTYSEYDVPDVSGSVGIKAMGTLDLANKLSQITGVPTNQIIGAESSVPVPLEMRIYHPDTHARIKTIYIPQARFNIPGFSAQVNSTVENTMNWTSEDGTMKVYKGARV